MKLKSTVVLICVALLIVGSVNAQGNFGGRSNPGAGGSENGRGYGQMGGNMGRGMSGGYGAVGRILGQAGMQPGK